MKIVGIIPARLGSTRLEAKVLRPIQGRPMIQHVWERVSAAKKLSKVLVACDDVSIEECLKKIDGKSVMTRKDHPNGTSRVAEVAEKIQADVFINIQGDEPMMHPEGIDRLAEIFEKEPETQVATLFVKQSSRSEYENPNVVKVVCDAQGYALYFSRSPLPYFREGTEKKFGFNKHLGIYGYRKEFLLSFVKWASGDLEEKEKLEQLRILERGVKIRMVETPHDSLSVDTAEDLERVEIAMNIKKSGVSEHA